MNFGGYEDYKSNKICFFVVQTINDVVLGVTQAGLSRYLNRRYGELSIFQSNDMHEVLIITNKA